MRNSTPREGSSWFQCAMVAGAMIFGLPEASGAVLYVDAASLNPVPPYSSWNNAAINIQDAIDVAAEGDLVLVTNGVYSTGGRVVSGILTNRVAINKSITVQSVNGPGATTILGYHIPDGATNYDSSVRCAYLGSNSVLNGFTLAGGGTRQSLSPYFTIDFKGAGACCEATTAVLTNCIITGNRCDSTSGAGLGQSGAGGAGVYQGMLENCVLSNNLAPYYGVAGGGAFNAVLNNCVVISNSASIGGGGSYCTLSNCIVVGNIAPKFGSTSYGGGLCQSTAIGCLIANNYCADLGGGVFGGALSLCIISNNSTGGWPGGGAHSAGSVNNCLIISNSASVGGGIYGSASAIYGCTIVGNTATGTGGGVSGSGTLRNSIIKFNSDATNRPSSADVDTGLKVTFCCTPGSSSWAGNFNMDPLFVNLAGADFHLQSNSPCINSGRNSYVTLTNDLDGNPRIQGLTVDAGAYEFQSPASQVSYAFLQQYGLPTDGSADFVDSDGDGANNWQESIAESNPTNSASFFAAYPPFRSGNSFVISWPSRFGFTYFVQRSTNAEGPPVFSTVWSNIPADTSVSTTLVSDPIASSAGLFLYRVGIQQ
jgi:hypothetical protein